MTDIDFENLDEVRASLHETRAAISTLARELVDAMLYRDADRDWVSIAICTVTLDQKLKLERLLERHLKVEVAG